MCAIGSQDVVKNIIMYVHPYGLKNFFEKFKINFALNFVYDSSGYDVRVDVFNSVFGLFPNVVIRGMRCSVTELTRMNHEPNQIERLVLRNRKWNGIMLRWSMSCYDELIKYGRLVHLEMYDDDCVRSSLYDLSILRNCVGLKVVMFGGFVELGNVSILAGCRNLKRIYVKNCDDMDISCLAKCRKLKYVAIEDYVIAGLRGLDKCVSVKHLVLRDVSYFDGFVANPGLESCVMSGCDVESVSFLRLCNLKHLSISSCGKLRNISLERCGDLKDVVVHSCVKVEVVNVAAADRVAVTFCTSLRIFTCGERVKWMDLSGCTNLVRLDGGGDDNRWKNLEVLNLFGCTRLMDVNALRECESLRELCLFGCRMLRNIDVISGLNLKILDARKCKGIEMKGLKFDGILVS